MYNIKTIKFILILIFISCFIMNYFDGFIRIYLIYKACINFITKIAMVYL